MSCKCGTKMIILHESMILPFTNYYMDKLRQNCKNSCRLTLKSVNLLAVQLHGTVVSALYSYTLMPHAKRQDRV